MEYVNQLTPRQIIDAQDMAVEGYTWEQIYQRTGITKEMYREMMELLNN